MSFQPEVDDIRYNWEYITTKINEISLKNGRNPADITVVAVTKTHPTELIDKALRAGIEVFGENYAQELKDKHSFFSERGKPQPRWHFIGHLQSNKIKYIAGFVEFIHSIDSLRLAEEVSQQAQKLSITIDILLQVNTSGEAAKSGCEPESAAELARSVSKLANIRIKGLMTIGSFTDDERLIRSEFRVLSRVQKELRLALPETGFEHLSMGMSGDYHIAIEEGATIVRIGSAIFGPRIYSK